MFNPFLYRRRGYPLKLIVDIHSSCNARCVMCPYPKYSRRQSQGQMDWPLYESIVEEFSRIGRDNHFQPELTYCYMSEPFLADDLSRYVRFAQERGIYVYLNTNAAAMTSEKVDDLLATGFRGKINISFHGVTPQVYERITGLDYQTSLKHTLYLIEKRGGENILVRGVDEHWPDGEREKWFAFWGEKNVELEYLPPISRCGAVKGKERTQNGRREEKEVDKPTAPNSVLKKKNNPKKNVRLYGCRCHLPLVEMVILFDGRVVMCCQDMGRELIWGDVGKDGITGVWNSTIRTAAVKKLYNGSPLGNGFLCARCEEALGPAEMIHSAFQAVWRKITNR